MIATATAVGVAAMTERRPPTKPPNRFPAKRAPERECASCGRPFGGSPPQVRRCPQCRTAGRGRCPACRAPVEVPVGAGQSNAVCPRCRDGRTPAAELTAGYVRLECRQVSAFGGRRAGPRCRGARIVTANHARRFGGYQGDGAYSCPSCLQLERWLEHIRRQAAGTGVHLDSWAAVKRFQRRLALANPAFVAEMGRPGRPGPGARVLASVPPSPANVRARMAGTWRKGAKVRIGLCPVCGRLTYTPLAMIRALPSQLDHHRACWTARLRSQEGRRWASRRAAMRSEGASPERIDEELGRRPPLPATAVRKRGPAPTSEVLTRDFGWAVCYLLGGDKVAVLAKRAGVARSVVSDGIARVLRRLPEPEVASEPFRRYVLALRDAGGAETAEQVPGEKTPEQVPGGSGGA